MPLRLGLLLVVAAVLCRPQPAAATPDGAVDEVAIMRQLRQLIRAAYPATEVADWVPTAPHPCDWKPVTCDAQRHVTSIVIAVGKLTAPPGSNYSASAFPPVERLPALEVLALRNSGLLPGMFAEAWGQPGAFPRLRTLELVGWLAQHVSLPDIQPGALPVLEALKVAMFGAPVRLPASWGGSPSVLPALRQLTIKGDIRGGLPPSWGSGLRSLEGITIQHVGSAPLEGGLPAAWVAPGAFPRLTTLGLEGSSAAPLPDILPGALPALASIVMILPTFQSALPTSWGSSPDVLPSLAAMRVTAPFLEPLPAEWAGGFAALRSLILGRGIQYEAPPAGALLLPPEWASGFPVLSRLVLEKLHSSTALPQQWADGGFRQLAILNLDECGLTGTLPADMFRNHPSLKQLSLNGNALTGSLPESWAASPAVELRLQHNRLAGPALPSAWLAPGSLPQLRVLDVGFNNLTGMLPPNLAWPSLKWLSVAGTRTHGSVPASWCSSPLSLTLELLDIGNTSISDALPACVADTMLLSLVKNLAPVERPNAQRAQRSAWLPAPLAALLLLAALVGAGAAGTVMWNRQVLRRRRAQRDSEEIGLLGPEEPPSHVRERGGSGATARPPGRRAAMSALLRRELGNDSGRCGVELMPLDRLPGVLAHQLGSMRQRPRQDCRGDLDGGLAQFGGPALHDSPQPSATMGKAEGRAAELSGGADGRMTSASQRHMGGPSVVPASRRWGLETGSLRVPAGEIDFMVDEHGLLVELGEGGHAVVYLARLAGQAVAAKVFELQPGLDSGAVWREVSLLRQACHPRVVPLYGVALKGQVLVLAMAFMEGGSLRAALLDGDAQRRHQLRWAGGGGQVAKDIAEALAYLHGQLGILHGDLKSANVLLDGSGRAYLGDLGLAQVVGASARTGLGCSHVYGAPEQLMGQRISLAADIHAMGVLLVELTTCTLVVRRGAWRLPQVPEECPASVLHLIQRCINSDPRQRPSAAQVLACLQADAEAG